MSAPGKSILIGEHAAVYGRPAVVAAVDLRLVVALEATAERCSGGGVRLDLAARPAGAAAGQRPSHAALVNTASTNTASTHPALTAWPHLAEAAARCREAWERYRDDPTPARFAALRGEQPGHLIRLALGEAQAHLVAVGGLDSAEAESETVWRLQVASDLPLGAGFGSSAALAVALVRAVFEARAASPDIASLETIEALALEVERRQHGAPSGIDGATVLRGGVLVARRDAGAALRVDPLSAKREILSRFRAVHTGAPSEETGAVVSAVRALRDREPSAFEARLDAMSAATETLIDCLRRETPLDLAGPLAPLRAFARELEAFGVVPEPIRRVTAEIEAAGGAAKISGAGSLRGPGAGSLLMYHPDPAVLDRLRLPDTWRRLALRYGAEGARREADEFALAPPSLAPPSLASSPLASSSKAPPLSSPEE